jgi:hypothetical protein
VPGDRDADCAGLMESIAVSVRPSPRYFKRVALVREPALGRERVAVHILEAVDPSVQSGRASIDQLSLSRA